MARSDFWSIAATLITAGIAYFIGGKWSAYGSIAVGVLIALYLLFTKKKEPTRANISVRQEANPTQTVNSNPQQNVNASPTINVYPERRPARPARTFVERQKPSHNLKLQACRLAAIEETLAEHGSVNGFCLSPDQSRPNAVIACIRNKSSEGEVAEVEDVRATLTFKDENMREIGHGIHQACWMSSGLGNPDFGLEETYCVILIMFRGDENATPYIKTENTSWGLGVEVMPYMHPATAPRYVELILVGKEKRLVEPLLFELSEDKCVKKIRLVGDDE